jgi:4-diphosphocytidyl-2-C-methyl-D-erythritol kinase
LNLATRAPAKLNLSLYVGPRRPDGLHEICSLFQPITLADEVAMEYATGGADEVVCPGIRGPNLAATALAAFRNRFGWDGPPVRVTIEKHIPVSSGLGGGSADAAAVLRLAAAASQEPPPHDEVADLAMSLGADVPSQLEPRTALVGGAGERVEPLPPRGVQGVLLAGRGALQTADVYRRADELGLARPTLDGTDPEALHNDLQAAAVDLEPEAALALSTLRAAGATHAQLSGSGPAAFGLFEDPVTAAKGLAAGWRGLTAAFESAPDGYAEVRSASAS